MGNYHITLCPISWKLCTIVLLWGKFDFKKLPIGFFNSPDIFQKKKDELFNGLEYIRAYIDDRLIISNGIFEDRLQATVALKKLKAASFKINNKNCYSPKII